MSSSLPSVPRDDSSSPPVTPDMLPSSTSPLPIMTEEDIAALPPVPSSSSSSSSSSAASRTSASPSPSADPPLTYEEEEEAEELSHGMRSSEEKEGGGNELDDAGQDAPVDAPLVMPESLPLPPSSSSSSPSSTISSPASLPTAAEEVVADVAPPPPQDTTAEESESDDAPTVIDSSASPSQQAEEDILPLDAVEETVTPVDNEEAAAAAASLNEEDVAASMRASEERASAALRQFTTSLHAKLVEQLIDDAAVAVERTLQDTVHQHSAHVRALIAHNRSLDQQLDTQSAHMRHLKTEVEESILHDLQRILRVDLRQVFRANGMELPMTLPDGSPSEERRTEVMSGPASPTSAQGDVIASGGRGAEDEEEERSTSSSPSATAAHRTRPNKDISNATSLEELTAAYLGTRNTIELLQREREQWRHSLSDLRASLLLVTEENAALRRHVEHLQTTTVDLEEHRRVAQAHEEAEHQCELLQLQLSKQLEEAETLAAFVERQELLMHAHHSRGSPEAAQATQSGTDTAAEATPPSDNDLSALRKGPVWDMAMRELEEQATVAANTVHLREQLAAAEAAARALEAERDAGLAYTADLQKEGAVLRADLQSMTYRNTVLSQQVASLLVKVETTARTLRRLQAGASAGQPIAAGSNNSSGCQDRTLVPSTLLNGLPSAASRRNSWLAAKWSSAKASTGFQTVPSAGTSSIGRSLNTAVLYGSHQRPSAGVEQLLLAPNASNDVSYLHQSTEVEEGLQQRLSTYAASHVVTPFADEQEPGRRSRQVSLRQLGSPTLDVELVCTPRLPASDQLSGTALGRPSTYSTLDPLRGTVTRRIGSAEVSVRHSTDPLQASSTEATVVESEDDVNTDPELLRMLDTLGKDESLDRFSVNSVAELVVRNQELVKQLYEATQQRTGKDGEAQQRQPHEQPETPRLSGVASPARAYDGSAPPVSLRASTDALQRPQHHHRAEGADDATAASRKRQRADADEASSSAEQDHHDSDTEQPALQQPRGSTGLVHSDHGGVDGAATGSAQDARGVPSVEPWFLEDASQAVASMVDAMVRRHEVRLTLADTDVSRALLRALSAQREADNTAREASSGDGSANLSTDGSPSSRAMAVCVRSLLQLCVRQSATLAEVALNAADQQSELQAAVQKTWTEVQHALLAALETSHAALRDGAQHASGSSAETLVASSLHSTHISPAGQGRMQSDGRASEANASASTVVPLEGTANAAPQQPHSAFRMEEQVTLLKELTALLQTAAKKDGTLLHVYQAAQARQEARQHEQRERMTRLLLKLERKRRIIKALRFRQTHVGGGGGGGMAAAESAGPTTALARGVSHATMDPENSQGGAATVVGGFRLSPQPGSPVHRTPPLPPMSLPAAGSMMMGSPQPQLLRHTQSSHARSDDEARERASSAAGASASDSDSDDQLDDDALTLDIFRELQQQLALTQANHRAVQEELDAEKERHTLLLERMWVLETAQDEAVAAAAALEKRVAEMLPRTEHEAVKADLASAEGDIEKLETQLSAAMTRHHELQESIAALKAQLEAQQLQAKLQAGEFEDTARKREQRIRLEEDRYRDVLGQLNDVKQHAAGLENAVALLRREVQDKDHLIRQRNDAIEELKTQTLMRDDVQGLLCRLYPDDRVLHANAQLVQHLSHTTSRLQLELAEAKQDLAHANDELRQRDLSVREAVQERQAAEVRLQDALARLAAYDSLEEETANGNSSGTAALQGSPTDALESWFNVESASVMALRQRVRYLTTCMEAQAKDLEVLRAAEAAWKAREEHLRRQLELMSADPISLTARKYGLTACASFTEQMAEMAARIDEVRHALDHVKAEKAELESQVALHVRKEAEMATQLAEAVAHAKRVEEGLAAATAQCEQQSDTISQQAAAQAQMATTHADLQRQYEDVTAEVAEQKRVLANVQASLAACTAQRDQFLSDNKQMISAVDKLEKALVQSEAEKVMAREALAQGLATSSRRHRGGGRSTTGERHQHQASLTQDLSLSSITPTP